MKFNINEIVKPCIAIKIKKEKAPPPVLNGFNSQLMKKKSDDHPFCGELLIIVEAAITLPVSNAWPKSGASALKIVKNRCKL